MNELENLLEGNKRFVSGNFSKKDLNKRREETLAGQKPFATILSCSDSRVVPEYIFDQGIGDLFIIRTAGNICDPIALGSIEYGIEHLKTPILVLLGHTKCGAVTAACSCKGKKEGNFIDTLVEKITPAVKGTIEESIQENLCCVEKEILEKSEVISKHLKEHKIKIIRMEYFLETGKVKVLD
ncbi:MAG: carbonic anhydrase [Candidatus Micrarchaeia archaeon]